MSEIVQSELPRYSLVYAGRRFEVEAARVEGKTLARLIVNGELADQQPKGKEEQSHLQLDALSVRVSWSWWSDEITGCVLLVPLDDRDKSPRELPFAPPAGSRAAKLAEFQREYPRLYATRHVLLAVIQVLLPLLGIGALLSALLPQFDLGWLGAIREFLLMLRTQIGAWIPDLNLPNLGIRELIQWAISTPVGEFIRWFWGWFKWVVPILIAISVAVREVQRRQETQDEQK